jgi:hypothetical protein
MQLRRNWTGWSEFVGAILIICLRELAFWMVDVGVVWKFGWYMEGVEKL